MSIKLDVKDRKILALLDENARYTNTQIAKKVGLSKPAVEYRIKRLENNNIIFEYYAVIDFTRLGHTPYKIYFKFQDTTVEDEEEIINYWINNHNTIWVGETRGRWDLAITILAESNHTFGNIIKEFMNKYAKFILEKNIFLIEYSPIYVREYMKSKTGEFLYGIPTTKIEIDDIDKKILKQLSTNSRISIVDLVNKTKLTRDVIVYRMKKLTEQKILVHYRCYPNYEVSCVSKIVLYTKNFDSKAEMRLKEYVREHKNSGQLLKLIGSWDIEIEFETKDEDELYSILTDIRKQFSHIIRDFDIIKIKKTRKYDFYPF